ncbi:MAG: DUF1059 domain-containing protein, partial [Rubrobacteraceae bacterium]
MRALLYCGCHLEAADEEELVREVLDHMRREHPVGDLDEAEAREFVEVHSYRYERIKVYADGIGPDEEFG